MQALWAVVVLLASMPLAADPLSWNITIDRLTAGPVILNQVAISNSPGDQSQAGISVAIPVIEIPGQESSLGPFSLACTGTTVAVIENLCRDGNWSMRVSDSWPVLHGSSLLTSFDGELLQVETKGVIGRLRWAGAVKSGNGEFSGRIEFPQQDIAALDIIGGELDAFSWIGAGQVNGLMTVRHNGSAAPKASAQISFSDVNFDSPEGLYAGLGIAATIKASLGTNAESQLSVEGDLLSGELLLMDFYRDFSEKALSLEMLADWGPAHIDISRFTVTDRESLKIIGQARLPLATDNASPEFVLREFRLDFPLAYQRYLASAASAYSLDGLSTSGSISWNGDWSPGSARSGELQLDRLTISDNEKGRFSIEGLDGQILTGSESRITWDALSFEKMNLGSGHASLALSQENVSLTEPLTIGVLGGHLDLEEFSFTLPQNGIPDVQLQAAVKNIEMLQMSRALGWPEFSGTLNGKIPGVSWKDGVIEIDGALEFQVFEGDLVLTDLRVERPFGVLPSMAANITATGLDLEELTQTFEFGRIGGRADGYVRNLRMLDWEPVQFDAWFGTPVNEDAKHGISRKAVQHLTEIGGGSATAILSGPILKLFNNFSYRRLGLGCELRNNVCRIRGIEEKGESILLLEGAGIPKISIQAFNRSVDWPQLLAELSAVSGGEEIRIGN